MELRCVIVMVVCVGIYLLLAVCELRSVVAYDLSEGRGLTGMMISSLRLQLFVALHVHVSR